MLTAWRRAWPASVLPVLALVGALAWPAGEPTTAPPTQAPAEVSRPRPAQAPVPEVRRTPAAAEPATRATVTAPPPAPAGAEPSPAAVTTASPGPATSTSAPGIEDCVEGLLGEGRLDC